MRLCQSCNCKDRPQIKGDVPCTCGTSGIFPEDHQYLCDALSHWVTPFYVPMDIRGQEPDKQRKAIEAFKAKYERKGFTLKELNGKYFAAIHWCIDCIGKHEMALTVKRDYERAANRALRTDETWAQMLCMD